MLVIDLETIEREISEIESTRDTTYRTCERLAWLYIVRDHIAPKERASRVTDAMSGSEFLRAASNVNFVGLMKVLDEHMSGVSVVNPKEYDAVMERIRSLK